MLVAALVLFWDDGTGDVVTGSTTTTAAIPTPAVDASTAVWPYAGGGIRYDDPVEAARGYAVNFVGFTDPVVGEFMQGDSRSGEVEVRALVDGPATTVFVRLLGGSWWVLGSASGDIEVAAPTAGEAVSSPVTVTGRSRAFEGTVLVEVRQDGGRTLARDFVTGGAGPELGDFRHAVTFETPTEAYGALLFTVEDADRGRVWEAGVLRVRFIPAGEPAGTQAALTEAVEQMLAGGEAPGSWFSAGTAPMLRGVEVDTAGAAIVDFDDLRPVIPNASSSAGSAQLLDELDSTVFGVPGVTSVEYRMAGSCATFFEWLQMECHVRTP